MGFKQVLSKIASDSDSCNLFVLQIAALGALFAVISDLLAFYSAMMAIKQDQS